MVIDFYYTGLLSDVFLKNTLQYTLQNSYINCGSEKTEWTNIESTLSFPNSALSGKSETWWTDEQFRSILAEHVARDKGHCTVSWAGHENEVKTSSGIKGKDGKTSKKRYPLADLMVKLVGLGE